MRGGLGWIGRNTLLLHRHAGSYFFLAELLTDLVLDTVPLPADHCGTCTRCLSGCPTGALTDYAMDPRRCISYLTIEHRTAIPVELRPALENWIFGCDVCQEVCPWNRDARAPAADDELAPFLPELLALDDAGFRARFRGTAVARTRRARSPAQRRRRARQQRAIRRAVPALVAALARPRAAGTRPRRLGARTAGRLRRARRASSARTDAEPDPAARTELEAALAG